MPLDPQKAFMMTAPFLNADRIPYFMAPGVVCISEPKVDYNAIDGFLGSWHSKLSFYQYTDDEHCEYEADDLMKFAGQMCYLSLGPKRTMNAEADRYFANIRESGHGSVLEHANFTILFWGVSRSFTHELVRHRAGFGFSQVSQRYVDAKTLRFVERPEFQKDEDLHSLFLSRISETTRQYEEIAMMLLSKLPEDPNRKPAEARKAVNQAARAVLTNDVEAPIVVTANVRAWRHFLEMRCHPKAEPEIRIAASGAYLRLKNRTILFNDYELKYDDDGYPFVETVNRKV